MAALDRSSRNRLTEKLLPHFTGDTLFDAIARAVCRAGCLPRKELFEAWEVARRVRLTSRGYRVVTQLIPVDITPKNRLILAEPQSEPAS